MARLGLLIDVTRCSGCHNCFLACRDEHYGNDYPGYSAAQPLNGQFWMQVNEIERGKSTRGPSSTTSPCPASTARTRRASTPPRTARCTGARTASSSSTR